MKKRTHDSARRRAFLKAGTLALFGGGLPRSASSATGTSAKPKPSGGGRAKRCILIYLLGGPPHQDIWDLKPEAPAEVRGPFQPIETTVPGIHLSEHLPLLARQAGHLAIVRSVSYPNNDHPYMIYYTLTGRVSPAPLGANTVLAPSRKDHPHLGAVVAKFAHASRRVPGYVAIPELRVRMSPVPVSGGGRSGFLGPRFDPFAVNEDPLEPPAALALAEEMTGDRLEGRQSLLAQLDGAVPGARVTREYTSFRESASQLVRSGAGRDLFALDKEPDSVRDRYGRHRFGRSLLLARRLVERDVSFVAIHFNYMSKCDGWDTHQKNFDCLKDELLPVLDQGLSALLEDLALRGLLDETLVVTMGEFGRTPRINRNAGRDHWGHCSSVVLAGGGVRGGNVVGASDKSAAYPTQSPVGPPEIVATMYHALGLEPQRIMYDHFLNRPMTLSDGEPIAQLF